MGRVCIDRHYDLQKGFHRYLQGDMIDIQHGDGLIFNIHPPVVTYHVV